KTDKVDAEVLAQLLRCDFLPRVWEPPLATQALRRVTARRASLVMDKTAIKNRIHAVLHQRLIPCPFSDLFGIQGRQWLQTLSLGDFRESLYPTCYAPGALPNRPDWTDIGDLGFLSLGYSFQEIALDTDGRVSVDSD